MNKAYNPITWQNKPSTATPLNQTNLNEMSNALDTIDDRVIVLDSDKVSKEAGKGLSSNDYTTAEKTKLAGIATGATAVSISDTLQDGDTIANITIDGTTTAIKAKQPNEQEMNVRSAMLLLSPTPIAENAPFVKRVSGGNVPFPALLKDKIIGASVVWNQLYKIPSNTSTTEKNCSVSKNTDGTITISGEPDSSGSLASIGVSNIKDHIYYIRGNSSDHSKITFSSQIYGADNGGGAIIKNENANDIWYYVCVIQAGSVGTSINVTLKPVVIDLTAMFGSTIADYVYTLESGTAGSGIAWLKSYGFFTEPYYAYSANTIQSVSVSAKVNKDGEDTTISTVALDHTTLRGLFKLDANNNLYADGDVYPSDGVEIVKYAIYTMTGQETFTQQAGKDKYYSNGFILRDLGAKRPASNNESVPIVTSIGVFNTPYNTLENKPYEICVSVDGRICFNGDTYRNVNRVGLQIIYEVATPTTATLTPYLELQNIASGGTEEFIDYGVEQGTRDVSIPVGGEREYYQGMEIPNLPTTAGNHNLQYNPSTGFSWS